MQEAANYPVRFAVRYPESLSRILNFPLGIGMLIKAVLAIPSLVVWYVLLLIALVLYLIATFAILFSGRFPRGMFNFVVGAFRLQCKVGAYLFSLTDQYPGFSPSAGTTDIVTFDADYPETSNRILNLPVAGLYIKSLLVLPQVIMLLVTGLIAIVLVTIAQFVILFSGRFPEGMFRFCAGTFQLQMRVNAYIYALTDKYPPFSIAYEGPIDVEPSPASAPMTP